MPKPKLTLYLAAPRGFCAGVDRAIKIVEMALSLVYVISASLFIRWRAEAAHV